MPRTSGTKKPYKPTNKQTIEIGARELCNQLNDYRVEFGEDGFGAIYKCPRCGSWFITQDSNFYKTPSLLYEKNGGYAHICKTCAQEIFDAHCLEIGGDVYKAMMLTCHELDWPYDETTFKQIFEKQRTKGHVIQSYADAIGNAKYTIGYSYSDTMKKKWQEEADAIAAAEAETNDGEEEPVEKKVSPKYTKYIEKARRFFGKNYTDEELEYLQAQYDDWVTRHESNTKAQEELYKSICYVQLKEYEGTATKDDLKSLQDLLDSASLKPKQQLETMLADQNTFGTLIQKFENDRPLPEPAPEWRDVDGIKKYIRTFFLGHLCKMFDFKNEYADEYEEELSKYTVEPPHYDDEDFDDGIASVLFKTKASNSDDNADADGGAP